MREPFKWVLLEFTKRNFDKVLLFVQIIQDLRHPGWNPGVQCLFQNNASLCKRSYSSATLSLGLMASCLNDALKKRLWIFVNRLKATYNWPGWKIFCLSKSKLVTTSCKLRPCTFCIVHTHDSLSRNCVRFFAIDLFVFLMIIEVSCFLIGNQLWILAVLFLVINFLPPSASSNFMCMMETSFSIISRCFTTPIYPLISLCWTSRFTVSIPLVSNFNFKHLTRPPVSDVLRFCAAITSL